MIERKFIAYFYFVEWSGISLGFHISLSCPNIEVHLPFGFIRIGWNQPKKRKIWTYEELENYKDKYCFGIK